jgi:hypothetical protein
VQIVHVPHDSLVTKQHTIIDEEKSVVLAYRSLKTALLRPPLRVHDLLSLAVHVPVEFGECRPIFNYRCEIQVFDSVGEDGI